MNVVQEWVVELPWKMQSVLIAAQRGPDHAHSPALKEVARWLRSVVQHNADTTRKFMQPEREPSYDEIKREIDFCPFHYAMHLIEALKIVAYKHPDHIVARRATLLWRTLTDNMLHSTAETEQSLDRRLADQVATGHSELVG